MVIIVGLDIQMCLHQCASGREWFSSSLVVNELVESLTKEVPPRISISKLQTWSI